MTEVRKEYEEIQKELQSKISIVKKKLNAYITYRLLSFLAIIAAFYFLHDYSWKIQAAVAIPLIVLFFYLIKKNKVESDKLKLLRSMLTVDQNEILALDKKYDQFHSGEEFINPSHNYGYDLDLFGKGSLFQYLCRAESISGIKKLASWFSSPSKDADELVLRQNASKELLDKVKWRQELQARISLCEEQKEDLTTIKDWSRSEDKMKISSFLKAFLIIVPLYSFTLLFLLSVDQINVFLFLGLILLPLIVTGYLLKTISAEYKTLEKAFKSISKFSEVFEFASGQSWTSEKLQEIESNTKGAEEGLTGLGKIVSSFDQRINILVMLFMNIFIAWDLRCLTNLYKWKANHKGELNEWFDNLATLEALCSLANFEANHKEFVVYPEFNTEKKFEYQNVGHPFLKDDERVSNTLSLSGNTFGIITGANMAGKSTFLRTVGVNMVLALSGCAVLAEKFNIYPIDLFTSMRTTDSLQDNKSYFYSELLRLSLIVEALESGQELFIILDEILKGTNSKDKAEGSFRFLEKIIKLNATGIVATHDLSLCTIEEKSPDQFYNYFFDVKIKEDDLDFDYKLRKGICSNMNATFLMEKMGIA